jgi:hypothetical protein
VAKVTWTPHVMVPVGSAAIAPEEIESMTNKTAGMTIRSLWLMVSPLPDNPVSG